MANGSKLYMVTYATVAAFNAVTAANTAAFQKGTLVFDEATGKVAVYPGGGSVAVVLGTQS
jgi:hypothetical protein